MVVEEFVSNEVTVMVVVLTVEEGISSEGQ